jgi:hypothetical protein
LLDRWLSNIFFQSIACLLILLKLTCIEKTFSTSVCFLLWIVLFCHVYQDFAYPSDMKAFSWHFYSSTFYLELPFIDLYSIGLPFI